MKPKSILATYLALCLHIMIELFANENNSNAKLVEASLHAETTNYRFSAFCISLDPHKLIDGDTKAS